MGFNLADYQPVEDRLRKFWDEHPLGRIATELLFNDDGHYIVKAAIYRGDELREGIPVATGLASETETQRGVNSTSALENCETSAIGRALANMGYAPKGKRPSREEMQKSQRPEPVERGAVHADGEDASSEAMSTGSGERGGGIEAPNVVGGASPSPAHIHEWSKTLPDGKTTRPGWVVCDECGTGERESKVTVLTAPVLEDEVRMDLK